MSPMPRRLEPSGSLRAYFGWRLRHWRRSRGMTQDALGQRIGYDNSQVSKVESGDRWPPEDLAQRCDEVLRTGGELAGLWPLVSLERRRVTGEVPAASGPAPAGGQGAGAAPRRDEPVEAPVEALLDDGAIAAMAGLLAGYRGAADHVHAATLVAPVEWHLDGLLRALTEQSTPPARLLPLAAEWAELAGWLRFDMGAHAAALAWYDRGHQWAMAAHAPDLASRLLARKSTAAWEDRDPVAAVGYAEAARGVDGIAPVARTWAGLALARAQALAGDRYACEKLLDAAAEETEAAARADGEPAWWWLRGPAGIQVPRLARATCLRELAARGVPGMARRAAGEFTGALAAIGDDSPRDQALFSARLADAYLHAGDPVRAVEAALRAADSGRVTRSRRSIRELTLVHGRIRERHPGLPGLPALTDRLHTARQAP